MEWVQEHPALVSGASSIPPAGINPNQHPLRIPSNWLPFVRIKVPHTVEVMPEKHAVIACRHRAAAAPLRQIITQLLAGLQIKRPLVGVKRVANYHRVLQMAAMVILPATW
ncbi:MAG: hypothetical protein Ct9H300mP7_5060 [Verrucomicrobiota bacterium]|nr:MAG: hypothetical protein Ct9H300mP7_5060 [Verrucomicrobiota bacterium]